MDGQMDKNVENVINILFYLSVRPLRCLSAVY